MLELSKADKTGILWWNYTLCSCFVHVVEGSRFFVNALWMGCID